VQVTHPGGQEVPRQSLHLKGRGYVCRNHTFISPPDSSIVVFILLLVRGSAFKFQTL